ncbi:MAG: helix-turn-helix domain-containing protein [Verrucomicrobiales bacterium]|jgi:transcriptional regulator with XRE-family HTH domain|nr:helix-turn-helix domain-containing protein [Verrucomicrobiales bacterium]
MNICGPQVKKYRGLLHLSQQELAEKCQLLGWDVSRDIIARIELRLRCVEDGEMIYLSRALKASPSVLLGYENECVKLCPFQLLKKVRLVNMD